MQAKIIILSLIILALSGCKPIPPTYTRENFSASIARICQEEYGINNVRAWLKGKTAWIYTPQDRLINKDKQFDKEILEEIFKVIRGVSRVLLSMRPRPEFYVIVASDTKNVGADLIYLGYVRDVVMFQFQAISRDEFSRRNVYSASLNPLALGDEQGTHITLYDITMPDFLGLQISQRITTKFQQEKFDVQGVECYIRDKTIHLNYKIKEQASQKYSGNIDREIVNIAGKVLKIYKFKDYDLLRTNNLASGKKTVLSRSQLKNRR